MVSYDGMKRTTVTLSDAFAEALNRAARRRHTSASEVVRQALAVHLGLTSNKARTLTIANLGDSGPNTLGRDHEGFLAKEWTRDRLMYGIDS